MGKSHWKASGLPLTQERLKQFLTYDPDTGRFAWLVSRPGRKSKHSLGAGERPHKGGGRMISVDGVNYSTAQLAWFYVYGHWPDGMIYRRNKDKADDRIENLIDSATILSKRKSGPITAERLRELTIYDPEIGKFFWRERPGREGGKTIKGAMVGSFTDQGYEKIGIDHRQYRAHRLAWLYMTGRWPKELIDHINLNRSDNRWINLREATKSDNRRNNAGQKNRKSPFKGCYRRPNGRWGASIQLGVFDTPEEAHAAYMKAARLFFGEFARGS